MVTNAARVALPSTTSRQPAGHPAPDVLSFTRSLSSMSKNALRGLLPLAPTPSPPKDGPAAAAPAAGAASAAASKQFTLPSAAEVDELRLGFGGGGSSAIPELFRQAKEATAGPAEPKEKKEQEKAPAEAHRSPVPNRGVASPYFPQSPAVVPPRQKQALLINLNQVRSSLLLAPVLSILTGGCPVSRNPTRLSAV